MCSRRRTTALCRSLPIRTRVAGRSGEEEIEALHEVILSGTLTSTKGDQVSRFESAFARLLGSSHGVACATGSAAVHVAVAALDPEPGDEVVTTPITDMGALSPLLYQGAIPVFADVDPMTGNVTAASIEAALSERTRAIVVTHLFGNPVRHGADRGAGVESRPPDHRGLRAGAAGDRPRPQRRHHRHARCFSLQQGKHITTGEGGIVLTDDEQLARRARVFVNKAWPYGEPAPDHEFLALNYRWTELQGAVANAQLPKLPGIVASRRETAAALTERLTEAELKGVALPTSHPDAVDSFWKYCLYVDPDLVPGGTVALGARLKERGIASAPRYIPKPAFACRVFREQRTFGDSAGPSRWRAPRRSTTGPSDSRESIASSTRCSSFPGTSATNNATSTTSPTR